MVGGGVAFPLHIYDISNPTAIKKKAIFTESQASRPGIFAVDSTNNYLYMVSYSGGGGNWIDVLNLTSYLPAPVNTKPAITSAKAITATELSPFSYTATAKDAESTPTITIDNTPSWCTVSGSTISGTPAIGAADTSFRVIASDGSLSDTAIVTVNVSDYGNTAPTIVKAIPDTAFATSTPISLGLLTTIFSDKETPNDLSFKVVSNSNNNVATVSIDKNTLQLTSGTVNGTTTVVIRATDPKGLYTEDTFAVTRDIVGISLKTVTNGNILIVGGQRIVLSAGVAPKAVSVVDLRGRELFRQAIVGSNVVLPAIGAGVQILRIETSTGVITVKRQND